MNLSLHLATKAEVRWAKIMVRERHYLHKWPHWFLRPSVYIITLGRMRVGLGVEVAHLGQKPKDEPNQSTWL